MDPLAIEDYIPRPAVIEKIIVENSQIKTFVLYFSGQDANESFSYLPGQFAMVSVPHCGEAPISFSSTPTRPGSIHLSVRKAGVLTSAMHDMQEGDMVGIRGPYGRPFPLEDLDGKNLLFVAGGIGLAPLRSVVNYCLDKNLFKENITILYGSRLPSDIAFSEDIKEWQNHPSATCLLTVDATEPGWDGEVGLVTALLDKIDIQPTSTISLVCGPPMMIGATLEDLSSRGFKDQDILTTLERQMKCGVGICRHCHMDTTLVCVDGPVFNRAQLQNLHVQELGT